MPYKAQCIWLCVFKMQVQSNQSITFESIKQGIRHSPSILHRQLLFKCNSTLRNMFFSTSTANSCKHENTLNYSKTTTRICHSLIGVCKSSLNTNTVNHQRQTGYLKYHASPKSIPSSNICTDKHAIDFYIRLPHLYTKGNENKLIIHAIHEVLQVHMCLVYKLLNSVTGRLQLVL